MTSYLHRASQLANLVNFWPAAAALSCNPVFSSAIPLSNSTTRLIRTESHETSGSLPQQYKKMVATELAPQLRFLTDAAHLLSSSAPETSAFLMSRRNTLLVDNDVLVSDTQRQHVCSCCGHIMIPGQGSNLNIETEKALRAKTRKQPRAQGGLAAGEREKPSSRSGMSRVFTCGNCSKYTKLDLPGPGPISRAPKIKKTVQQTTTQGLTKAPAPAHKPGPDVSKVAPATANANSKKRAKNRKAGLQALLDQRQGSTPSSGFGLSLSDFMKK